MLKKIAVEQCRSSSETHKEQKPLKAVKPNGEAMKSSSYKYCALHNISNICQDGPELLMLDNTIKKALSYVGIH